MKKHILSLILTLFCISFSFSDILRIKQDANIREAPSKNANILKVLKTGDVVQGNYSANSIEWFEINMDNKKCFIHNSLAEVELVESNANSYEFDTSKLYVEKGKGWIGFFGTMLSFAERHPIWAVIIALLLDIICVSIAGGVSTADSDEATAVFGTWAGICDLLITIGIIGVIYAPSTIKKTWDSAWEGDCYSYEITDSEFIYSNGDEEIKFPYRIENDYICLSPSEDVVFTKMPSLDSKFKFKKDRSYLTFFFRDGPVKCVSTGKKYMLKAGTTGVVGSVFVSVGKVIYNIFSDDKSKNLNSKRSFLTTTVGENNQNYVYRVIRPDENPKHGLHPKNANRNMSIEGHVISGSRNNGSQYISTTTDYNIAKQYADRDGCQIVKIDLNKVPDNVKVYDLSTKIGQDTYLKGTSAKNFANASKEVLLEGDIPPEAIKIIK